MREETERGDIAKSLQEMIGVQFMSKHFNDIYGATRLTQYDINVLTRMYSAYMVQRILSVTAEDAKDDNNLVSKKEHAELKFLFSLKQMAFRNPNAFASAIYYATMYFYGLAKQSEEGGSRTETVQIAGGGVRRVFDSGELGYFDKLKRRLQGKVLYPE